MSNVPTWPGTPTINNIKALELPFFPLTLIEIEWLAGLDANDQRLPVLNTLYLCSTGALGGGSEPTITWSGRTYLARIKNSDIAMAQALSGTGIAIAPSVRLLMHDPDHYIWQQEVDWGFRGARMTVRVVFWEPGTTNFSSDSRVIFTGVCNSADESNDLTIALEATSKLALARVEVPTLRVQRRCPWKFPDTAAKKAEANNANSWYWNCGDTNQAHTSCNKTPENCVLNGMWVDRAPALINGKPDVSKRESKPKRFGGIGTWTPPYEWQGKYAFTGKDDKGRNIGYNAAIFGDYVPLLYGTTRIEPMVLTQIGSPNDTKLEALVCYGKVVNNLGDQGGYYRVICNDMELPFNNGSDKSIVDHGWWAWSSNGDRDGAGTADPPYGLQGDCFGSLAVVEVAVARGAQNSVESNALPALSMVASGPEIWCWTDVNTKRRTNNQILEHEIPAWQVLDLLTWANWEVDEFNLQTWIDAAAHCFEAIMSRQPDGSYANRSRYLSSVAVRDRRSLAELITGILNGMRGILVFENGKLSIYVKKTLADQQPAPVAGSNDNNPYASYRVKSDSQGQPPPAANGYVAYHFDDSKILRDDSGASTLKINKRRTGETPNSITYQFFNRDNAFQLDTLTITDDDDAKRIGQEMPTALPVIGPNRMDHAARVMRGLLAETLRGNGANDSSGTLWFTWKSSVNAMHLRPGHIVALSSRRYSFGAGKTPQNYPQKQLVRLTAVKPSANWQEITFEGFWHEDSFYTDYFGDTGDYTWANQNRGGRKRRPYPWSAFDERVPAGDPLYESGYTFGLQQNNAVAPDGDEYTWLTIKGKKPVNIFAKGNARPPYVSHQGEGVASGGRLRSGQEYYACVSAKAVDATGSYVTAPSAIVKAVMPAGARATLSGITDPNGATITFSATNTFTVGNYVELHETINTLGETLDGEYVVASRTASAFTLRRLDSTTLTGTGKTWKVSGWAQEFNFKCSMVISSIAWGTNVSGYHLFVGRSEDQMYWAGEYAGNPATITVIEEPARTFGPPDVQAQSLQLRAKKIRHSGVFGQPIDTLSTTAYGGTIGTVTNKIQILASDWTPGMWAGRGISIIGDYDRQFGNAELLPVWNFRVVSNTADTLTVGGAAISAVENRGTGDAAVRIEDHGYETYSGGLDDFTRYTIRITGASGNAANINGKWNVRRRNQDWVELIGCVKNNTDANPSGAYVVMDLAALAGQGAVGVAINDVAVMRSQTTSANATTLTDSNWINHNSDGASIIGIELGEGDFAGTCVLVLNQLSPFKTDDYVRIAASPGDPFLTGDFSFLVGDQQVKPVDFRRVSVTGSTYPVSPIFSGNPWCIIQGLRPHDEAGKVIHFVAGTGAGYSVPIIDNDQTTIAVAAWPWGGVPDATSRYLIEEPGYLPGPPAEKIENNVAPSEVSANPYRATLPTNSMWNTTILVEPVLVDPEGRESVGNLWREVYIFHQSESLAEIAAATPDNVTNQTTAVPIYLTSKMVVAANGTQYALGGILDLDPNAILPHAIQIRAKFGSEIYLIQTLVGPWPGSTFAWRTGMTWPRPNENITYDYVEFLCVNEDNELTSDPWRTGNVLVIGLANVGDAPAQPSAVSWQEVGPRKWSEFGRPIATLRGTLSNPDPTATKYEVRFYNLAGTELMGQIVNGPWFNPDNTKTLLDVPVYAPTENGTWIGKVSAASASAENDWSTAVASDQFTIARIGDATTSGNVTGFAVGDPQYVQDENGVWHFGFTVDGTVVGTQLNFWTFKIAYQWGYLDNGVWVAWAGEPPISQRKGLEYDTPGAFHDFWGGFTVPSVGVGLKLRVEGFARSRAGDDLTAWKAQSDCLRILTLEDHPACPKQPSGVTFTVQNTRYITPQGRTATILRAELQNHDPIATKYEVRLYRDGVELMGQLIDGPFYPVQVGDWLDVRAYVPTEDEVWSGKVSAASEKQQNPWGTAVQSPLFNIAKIGLAPTTGHVNPATWNIGQPQYIKDDNGNWRFGFTVAGVITATPNFWIFKVTYQWGYEDPPGTWVPAAGEPNAASRNGLEYTSPGAFSDLWGGFFVPNTGVGLSLRIQGWARSRSGDDLTAWVAQTGCDTILHPTMQAAALDARRLDPAFLGDGLTKDGGTSVLKMKVGDGLEFVLGAAKIKTDTGITATAAGVSINAGDGLTLDAIAGKVKVLGDDGITATAAGVRVNTGSGLTLDVLAGTVKANTGPGILTDADGKLVPYIGSGLTWGVGNSFGVAVNASTGLEINGGAVGIKIGVGITTEPFTSNLAVNTGPGLAPNGNAVGVNAGAGLTLGMQLYIGTDGIVDSMIDSLAISKVTAGTMEIGNGGVIFSGAGNLQMLNGGDVYVNPGGVTATVFGVLNWTPLAPAFATPGGTVLNVQRDAFLNSVSVGGTEVINAGRSAYFPYASIYSLDVTDMSIGNSLRVGYATVIDSNRWGHFDTLNVGGATCIDGSRNASFALINATRYIAGGFEGISGNFVSQSGAVMSFTNGILTGTW